MVKSLPLYLLLVGVPVAGLVAILRAGAGLQAPPPIGGEWRVEGPAVGMGTDTTRTLAISQSGEHVEVAMGRHALRGRLSGDTLVAERRISRTTSPGPCSGATDVRLHVRIDTAARPLRLQGALHASAPGCAPVPVTALRADAAPARR